MRLRAAGSGSCAMIAMLSLLGAAVASASAQPVNDDCLDAVALTSPSTTTSTTSGATGFGNSPCGLPNDFFDVWYSFTAPQAGAYRFDMQLSPGYIAGTLALYDACGGEALACDDGPDSGPTAGKPEIIHGFGAGQTVLVRVAMCCGDRWPFTLRIGPGVLPPIPPNDDCAAAITLSSGVAATGDNINATGGLRSAPCIFAFNDTRDVWYSFTAPVAGHYEFRSRGMSSASFNAFHTTLAIFHACNGQQLACGDDFNPEAGSRIVHRLGAGEQVKVRVAGWAGGEGTFEVIARPGAPVPPPLNDTCGAARAITGFPYTDSVAVSGAADDPPAFCSGMNLSRLGVWWTLVPDRDTNIIVLNNSVLPVSVSIYAAGAGGTCAGSEEIACYTIVPGAGHTGLAGTEIAAGRRYWIMMAHLNDRPLSADAVIAPHVISRGRDTCDRAESLPFPASTDGGNFPFTDEGFDATCGPDRGVDVWYEFVAPAPAVYRFALLDRPRPGLVTMDGAVLSLYSGCGGAELGCAVNTVGGSTAAVTRAMGAGERVLVRAASNFALWGTFALEVSSTAPASTSPNDGCAGAIAWPSGMGTKVFTVNGSEGDPGQAFAGTLASAAAGLGAVPFHGDTWYRWVPPATGILGVRTNIAGVRVAAYAGADCPPAAASLLNATVNDTEMYVPVTGGQPLLFQVGATTVGATFVANLHLSLTPYQGACCTGGACAVRTSTDCAGSFLGANTACGPVDSRPQSFTDSTVVEIPQSTTPATRTIAVPAAGAFAVGAVAVEVVINHTELSDVVLTLSHGGRTVTLARASGVPNELSGLYILSDASLNPLSLAYAGATRYAAPGGHYRASNITAITQLNDPAAGFGGMTSAGDWTLGVRDAFNINRGWIKGWKLVLLPRSESGSCAAPSTGACCRGATCAVEPVSACTGAATRLVGPGAACNAAGDIRTPCCVGDFDQSGGAPALQDLFEFLTAWFGRQPAANADRAGGVDIGDLLLFLQGWFGGC